MGTATLTNSMSLIKGLSKCQNRLLGLFSEIRSHFQFSETEQAVFEEKPQIKDSQFPATSSPMRRPGACSPRSGQA